MGENVQNYPYGRFPAPLDYPWFEPLTVLAVLAGVTERIRLSSGIVIAPLRPAVLLAKQIATLDVMSRGRVSIGLGVGWQKEEYDAAGIPWEGRNTRFFEQIEVCRLLWSEAPAAFHGKTVNFDKIYSYPRPVQARVPIWLGIAPTERNIERMAKVADGWIPMEQDPRSSRRSSRGCALVLPPAAAILRPSRCASCRASHSAPTVPRTLRRRFGRCRRSSPPAPT